MARLREEQVDVAVAVILGTISIGVFLLLLATDPSLEGGRERDFFDSPGYWPIWLLFPVLALTAGLVRPERRSAVIATGALLGPGMVILAIGGTVGHNPDNGASFWIVGEVFLVIQAMITLLGGLIGAGIGRVSRPRPWCGHARISGIRENQRSRGTRCLASVVQVS